MAEVVKGEGYRDLWRRDRAASEQALSDLEGDAEREDEFLDFEAALERSRNQNHRDRKSYCPVHHRHLGYLEWTGVGCLWCYHGSQEAYNAYLESHNLGRDGRPKRARPMRTIA